MQTLWFALAAGMVAIYVVMDGFDFGAGALHLWVARGDAERRQVLGAIGPFWDGNEVWLLAAGGGLFLAFPKVLGSGLSGLYLAVMMRSEEHTSELQSRQYLVCPLLCEKKEKRCSGILAAPRFRAWPIEPRNLFSV